jgi:hypothetical protein
MRTSHRRQTAQPLKKQQNNLQTLTRPVVPEPAKKSRTIEPSLR